MDESKRPLISTETHLAAVRFATSNLERVVANAILKAPPAERKRVFKCLMQAYYKWMQEVKNCIQPATSGPDTPDCPKDWIPVGDDCIPPPPSGG